MTVQESDLTWMRRAAKKWDAPREPYRCVLADPPWHESGGGKSVRGAQRHYRLMRWDQIVAVMLDQLPDRVADNAHLWLWVTNNHLEDGLRVMKHLDFRYITNLVWVKPSFGLGQYLRGQHELLLFGVLGKLPSMSRSKSTVVRAEKRGHSVKPDEVYEVIEAVSPGPRLEMFARRRREGWDCWGDQAPEAPADNVTLLSSDGG